MNSNEKDILRLLHEKQHWFEGKLREFSYVYKHLNYLGKR